MNIWKYQQGETIGIPLYASGDTSQIQDVACEMRISRYYPVDTRYAGDNVGPLEPIPLPTGGGWLMRMTDTYDLVPGYYVIDARIPIGGTIFVTEPVGVEIETAVTGYGYDA